MLTEDDKEWLGARIETIREESRDTETKLLTAFHGWASPVETRARAEGQMVRALQEQVDYLTKRVRTLEERLPAG